MEIFSTEDRLEIELEGKLALQIEVIKLQIHFFSPQMGQNEYFNSCSLHSDSLIRPQFVQRLKGGGWGLELNCNLSIVSECVIIFTVC